MMDILKNKIHDPHQFLGLQQTVKGKQVIRLWRPEATVCFLEIRGEKKEAKKIDSLGLFEVAVPNDLKQDEYKVFHPNGSLSHDPYVFPPVLGDLDLYLINKGLHYDLYNLLGAHIRTVNEIKGVHFAVWAPNAKAIALVGDFNHWDGRLNPMRSLGSSGVWEIFIPGIDAGQKYKFLILTQSGEYRMKMDPFANFAEVRPKNASIVTDLNHFQWKDAEWMKGREKFPQGSVPINIYEVHLGSWRQEKGEFLNYKELAHSLTTYCLEMGFTHVELMGICEHPLDESWGYQVTGYFAPTSRYGTPEDFQYFVNYLHEQNLGVILDWAPAHFPADSEALAQFDGSYLYEHSDWRQGYHPHWNTFIFNYGRVEVSNFLIASALFWFEKMHIDGLRVDAVASMLYLDYGRNGGEWIPNQYGSNINLEALEFIKHLNSIVHERHQGILMIAEESTAFGGITKRLDHEGLGFDLKWNMGWMNDTLSFFTKEFPDRRYFFQSTLTFVMWYAFCEKFVLVLSHDEVVHGKRSLLGKMPGYDSDKFAGVRLLISFMICMPGKKLLFMGAEIGQWHEWDCKKELDWYLLQYERHQHLKNFVKGINHFYLNNRALYDQEFHYTSFEWIDFSDDENLVISYLRKGGGKTLLCVHHFKWGTLENYQIKLRKVAKIHEVFNSDREEWDGSGKINSQAKVIGGGDGHVEIVIPPFATLIFDVEFENS